MGHHPAIRKIWQIRTLAAVAAIAAIGAMAGGCATPAITPDPSPSASRTFVPVVPLPTALPDVLSFSQTLPLYEYNRTAPFALTESASYPAGKATAHDITYKGANGEELPAYLIVPPGNGPFAGVIWMGWSGTYSQIREEFVDEAVRMADKGVVSLLISGYFPWFIPPRDIDADRMGMIGQVRELRRAVDLLLAQPGVDANRIAFVGHSMAAMHGANLVAVDHRVKAAVLMGPSSTMTDWIFQGYGLDPETEAQYRLEMASFDPLAFVAHAAPSALFFQFAADDGYVTRATADSLFGAASSPKKVGWYSGGHDLTDPASATERDAWLATQLALPDN